MTALVVGSNLIEVLEGTNLSATFTSGTHVYYIGGGQRTLVPEAGATSFTASPQNTVTYDIWVPSGGSGSYTLPLDSRQVPVAFDQSTNTITDPTAIAALQAVPGLGVGAGGASYWFSGTWDGLQSATTTDLALGTPTLDTGYNVSLITDITSGRGKEFFWDATKWRSVTSGYILDNIGSATSLATGTTPQLVKTAKAIPGKLLSAGDRIELYIVATKSAAGTESMTVTLRLGTTGTNSDAAIFSAAFTTAAQFAATTRLLVLSDTSIVPATVGAIDSIAVFTTPGVIGTISTNTSVPSAITVSDISADAYLSLWVTMGGSVQTPRIGEYVVRVL